IQPSLDCSIASLVWAINLVCRWAQRRFGKCLTAARHSDAVMCRLRTSRIFGRISKVMSRVLSLLTRWDVIGRLMFLICWSLVVAVFGSLTILYDKLSTALGSLR